MENHSPHHISTLLEEINNNIPTEFTKENKELINRHISTVSQILDRENVPAEYYPSFLRAYQIQKKLNNVISSFSTEEKKTSPKKNLEIKFQNQKIRKRRRNPNGPKRQINLLQLPSQRTRRFNERPPRRR